MSEPTIEQLQEQTNENLARIRYMKRMRAFNRLIKSINATGIDANIMPNDDILKKIYLSSIDFVAQYRAMFKPHKFKSNKELDAALGRGK